MKKHTITAWEAIQIYNLLLQSGYVLKLAEESGKLKENDYWNYHSKKIKKEYNLRMKSMANIFLPTGEKINRKSNVSPF